MHKFRKLWDKQKNDFMIEHKTMGNLELFSLVCERFPECAGITFNAFCKARSRAGASLVTKPYQSRRKISIGDETVQRGYVYVKTEKGNVQKNKIVYMENHPEYVEEAGDQFVFLDGDNRNFDPENIFLLKNREKSIFQFCGGTCKGNPEATRINILRARLKIAELDLAEKAGLVCNYGSGRQLKDDRNEKSRTYSKRHRQNNLARCREQARKRYRNMTPEQRERYREYHREYERKKRNDEVSV